MKGHPRARGAHLGPPRPRPAPARGVAPASLTFFLTAAQRRAILARLRGIRRDRAAALLIALGLDHSGDSP